MRRAPTRPKLIGLASLQRGLLHVDRSQGRWHRVRLHMIPTTLDLLCRQQERVDDMTVRADLDSLKVLTSSALPPHQRHLLLVCEHKMGRLALSVDQCARPLGVVVLVAEALYGVKVGSIASSVATSAVD